MEDTPENILIIRKYMEGLKGMPGLPEAAITHRARAIARIVRYRTRQEWIDISPEYAEVLGSCKDDLQWLMDRIIDTFEFFPSMLAIRTIYERHFTPADGKTSGSLTAGLPERGGKGYES